MDQLHRKVVEAARIGGYLGDRADEEAWVLEGRGHAQYVRTTGRWVLTEDGFEAATAAAVGEAA